MMKLKGTFLLVGLLSLGAVSAWALQTSGGIPASGAGSGTVTSVACGTGLSGGTITTTGTCSITNAAVQAHLTGSIDLVSSNSATPIVTETLAGGTLGIHSCLQVVVSGSILYNNNNADTLDLKIVYGSTTFTQTRVVGLGLSASKKPIYLTGMLCNNGGAALQIATQFADMGGASWASTSSSDAFRSNSGNNGTENSANALTFQVTATWSASASTNEAILVAAVSLVP